MSLNKPPKPVKPVADFPPKADETTPESTAIGLAFGDKGLNATSFPSASEAEILAEVTAETLARLPETPKAEEKKEPEIAQAAKKQGKASGKKLKGAAPASQAEKSEVKKIPRKLTEIFGDRTIPNDVLEIYNKTRGKLRDDYVTKLRADFAAIPEMAPEIQAEPVADVIRSVEPSLTESAEVEPPQPIEEVSSASDAEPIASVKAEEDQGIVPAGERRAFHADGSEYVDFSEALNPRIAADTEDAPEHIKEIIGKSEANAERGKLRGLIDKLTGGVKEKFDWYKSSSEKLIRRNEELDAQAEKISGGERLFRALGEKYNKMGWKSKLALGASLGIGAGISVAAASVPAMIGFVGLVGAQRAAGLASMYMKFEKAASHGEKKDEKFWQWGQKEKAMAKAILYTAGMTAGMAYAVKEISETDMAHRTQEWLGDTFSKIYGAVTGGTDAAPTPVPAAHVEAPAQAPAVAAETGAHTSGFQSEVRHSDLNISEQPKATGFQSEVRHSDMDMAHVGGTHQAAQADVRHSDLEMHKGSWSQADVRYSDMQHAEAPAPTETAAAAPLAAAKLDSAAATTGGPAHIEHSSGGGVDGYTGTEPEPVAAAAVTEGRDIGISGTDREETIREAREWAAKGGDTAPVAGDWKQGGIDSWEAIKTQGTEAPVSIEGQPPITTIIAPDYKDGVAIGTPDSVAPAGAENTGFTGFGAFENAHGVQIDPAQPHIYQADSGQILVSGGTHDAGLDAGQEFAKENPGTSVFVQADKPVLHEGKLTPFVYEVRYDKGVFGIGGGMKILGMDGPIDEYHIGAFKPDTFIKQIDQIDLGPKGGLEGAGDAIRVTPEVVAVPEAPAPAVEALDASEAVRAKEIADRLIEEANAKNAADAATRAAAEKAVQEAAEAKALAAQQVADEATRRAETVARMESLSTAKIVPADEDVLQEVDKMAGRTGPVQDATSAAGGPRITVEGEKARLLAEEAAAKNAETVRVTAGEDILSEIDNAAIAAKVESARLLAEAKANEAARVAAEKAAEAAAKAQEEVAATAQKLADEAARRAEVLARVQAVPDMSTDEATKAILDENDRVAAARVATAPVTEVPTVPAEAPKPVDVVSKAPEAPAAPEPTPTVETPKVAVPAQEAVAPKAPAPEVGTVTNKVLNTLPTEQLDKMMTPEILKAAQIQESKGLALFDGGFLEKGVDSPMWKAVSNKPVEYLLAVNNSSVMKKLIEAGQVDAKYLGKPVAFAQEVLGIERDAHAVGISEKFGNIHKYLNELALGRRNIPPISGETVAAYMKRASMVFALRK